MYNYLHDFVQLRSSFLCFLEFLSFSSLSYYALALLEPSRLSLPGLFDPARTQNSSPFPLTFSAIFLKYRGNSRTLALIPYACLLETNLKVGNKLRIYEIENNISACYRFLSLAHSLIRTRASPHSLS